MSRFIKLSNCVINTRHVAHIDILPKSYIIYYNRVKHDGFFIFSVGWINNNISQLSISAEKELSDYRAVSKWIEDCNKKIEK